MSISFHIEPHWKKILLEGLDDIAMTLLHEKQITSYEKTHNV
jgi:3-isopropylmalate/(R)-2-methylmalate dehydratase small subunit